MRTLLSWTAALILPAMILTGPLVGADKKTNPDKDGDKTSEKSSDKYIKVNTVSGKIMSIYDDKRKLRVQISVPKLNPQALASMQQAQTQMALAAAQRNYVGVVQARNQMAQQQRNMYTNSQVEVEVQAIDDVVVRTMRPREAFDDKGKIKKFTRAELKELKGPDPKQPGYKAEFGDLTADQIIQVTIVRKKGDPPPKAAPKKKGKGDDADPLGEDTPLVGMIMIVADPPPSKK